jgi:hypothetical protein
MCVMITNARAYLRKHLQSKRAFKEWFFWYFLFAVAKPTKFPEATTDLAKPANWDDARDGKCGSLPVYVQDTGFVSLWSMPVWGRICFLFSGKIWLKVYSTGHPPVSVVTTPRYFIPNEGAQ